MSESPGRTMVCSVLFVDIVEYSKKSVHQQHKLKQTLNRILAEALETVAPMDRVILDTGDGAAVTFTGDPEDALFAALKVRDNAVEVSVRMGINLGPVRMVRDLNGQVNVIGDGINVAHRIMDFSQPGQLLVSRAFYEVASCLSDTHVSMFEALGMRRDKHYREHEVFEVGSSLHAVGTGASLPLLDEATSPGRKLATRRDVPDQSARVFDAGESLIISGPVKASVTAALEQLLAQGAKLISPVTQVQNKWMATCGHPPAPPSACQITELGFARMITGPTREAVAGKVDELVQSGAVLTHDIECVNGVWTAVCEARR